MSTRIWRRCQGCRIYYQTQAQARVFWCRRGPLCRPPRKHPPKPGRSWAGFTFSGRRESS